RRPGLRRAAPRPGAPPPVPPRQPPCPPPADHRPAVVVRLPLAGGPDGGAGAHARQKRPFPVNDDVDRVWRCRDLALPVGRRTLLMAIINVTPDSFSGDGLAHDVAAAVAAGVRAAADGADLLDIGGESTR